MTLLRLLVTPLRGHRIPRLRAAGSVKSEKIVAQRKSTTVVGIDSGPTREQILTAAERIVQAAPPIQDNHGRHRQRNRDLPTKLTADMWRPFLARVIACCSKLLCYWHFCRRRKPASRAAGESLRNTAPPTRPNSGVVRGQLRSVHRIAPVHRIACDPTNLLSLE